MIQNGSLIRLNLGGSLIAKLTSNDLSLEAEMLDATDKLNAGWRAVQTGNKQFSMSCEGFVVDPYDKNIILFSENFGNAYWDKTAFTFTAARQTDPFGFQRAFRTNGWDDSANSALRVDIPFSLPVENFVFSIWVRAVSGTKDIRIDFGDDAALSQDTFTATTTWQRIELPYAMQSGDNVYVELVADEAGEIEVFGAQLEAGLTATEYQPTGLRFQELFQAVANGTQFTAVMSDAITGNKQYNGPVLINSISLTAPQGQLCTFSCELTGNGIFNETTI